MKRQPEINGFAVFLICSLVPLVSLAPTVTSEGKITAGQKQKHFTTKLKPLASMLEMQAMELFENYSTCISATPKTMPWLMADSQARELVRAIPECPAFDSSCCALHVFNKILKKLSHDVEGHCGAGSAELVNATVIQLEVILSERADLYVCRSEDLPQVGTEGSQQMKTAKKTTYVWRLLQKYEQFMQKTAKVYSSTDM